MQKPNKILLDTQIQFKQQQSLKCIEFATQYMLKRSQYRFLNPLHRNSQSLAQVNQRCQLMAQLNGLAQFKKPQQKVQQKAQQPFSEIQQIQQSKVKFILPEQQDIDSNGDSILRLSHSIILTQSQNKTNLDHSSILSSTSKRSKKKFQQVTKRQTNQPTKYVQQELNFKKIKSNNVQTQTQNVIKPEQVIIPIKSNNYQNDENNQDDEDSFDSFPLGTQQKQGQQQLNLNKQDLSLYNSSRAQSIKLGIGIVSQHESQHQISVIIPRKQIKPISRQESDNRHEFIVQKVQQKKNNSIKQKQKQKQHKTKEQISQYLLKLQSFDVQQEMIHKKIHKIWNRPFHTINKLDSLMWKDLNLNKPLFKNQKAEYARIIE